MSLHEIGERGLRDVANEWEGRESIVKQRETNPEKPGVFWNHSRRGGLLPAVAFLEVPGHRFHSSRVERSPTSRPSSCALSRRRMIFPLRVLGSFSGKAMSAGTAIAPRVWRT